MRLSAAFVLLVSASAMAQLAFQAASPSYNGQNVSAISLIANPHRDLQPLYPLVTQKPGEPYSQDKIEADAKALQQAGHFPAVKAAVVPEVAGLRVLFLLEPAYYLGVVEFPEGTKLFSYTRLLKAGKPYSRERVTAATTLMKRALTGQHRLASNIKEDPPKYDPETNRVEVSFTVKVGPVVTIRAEGAKLSAIPFLASRQMKKLVPIYSEGSVDRELVEEGQRNLSDYFQKKGFYDVNVTTNLQSKADQVAIVYKIDRGRKHKVDRIVFQGNYAVSTKELLAQVVVKKSHIWTHGSLSQKLLKQSTSNIEAFYRDRGYEEVKITARAVDREPKIDVDVDIEEGQQTLVQDVQVSGNHNLPYAQLTAPKGFELRSGVPFSPRKMADDRNRISATYLNRGYLNAEVKATAQHSEGDPHRVNVNYAIDEHQMVRTDEVLF